MRRIALVAMIVCAFVLAACQRDVKVEKVNFQLIDGKLNYENNNRCGYSVDLSTQKISKQKKGERIFGTDGNLYSVCDGVLCAITDKGYTEMGSAPIFPDEKSTYRFLGVEGQNIYYTNWSDILVWNYETSCSGGIYHASQPIYDSKFAMINDGIYFVNKGLNKVSFDGQFEKINIENVTDINAYNGALYYSVYTGVEGVDSSDSIVWPKISYRRLDSTGDTLVKCFENVKLEKPNFAISNDTIWMVNGYIGMGNPTPSLLTYNLIDGSESEIPLGEMVETTGNILSNSQYVIFIDWTGTEVWMYDIRFGTLDRIMRR